MPTLDLATLGRLRGAAGQRSANYLAFGVKVIGEIDEALLQKLRLVAYASTASVDVNGGSESPL